MRLLVYEFACGGGFAESIPSGVLCEGYGMLQTLCSVLKSAGHHVTTVLDERIFILQPCISADKIIPVKDFDSAKQAISNLSKQVDAVYVIAPETNSILQSLVQMIEQSGATSLNCPSQAIASVCDKAALQQSLARLGVAYPKTILGSTRDGSTDIKKIVNSQFSFPVIFKLQDGVSCEGLSIVKDEKQIDTAIAKIKKVSPSDHFLIQEYLQGPAVSVSLLSNGKEVLPLSLNKQDIVLAAGSAKSSYNGGLVPFDHPQRGKAFAVAQKVGASFGLKGYFGVDLVLTADGPVVVDVNPRLTTSYIGYNAIAEYDLAEALLNTILNGKLPTKSATDGYCCLSKLEITKPSKKIFQRILPMPEVISPPFLFKNNKKACALIACKENTSQKAQAKANEVKKRIIQMIG